MTQRGVRAQTGRAAPGPAPVGAPAPAVPAGSAARPRTVEEQLLDGSQTGVLACDERRVVRSANPAALRLLPGLTVGEVLGGPQLSALADAGPVDPGPVGADVELTVDGRALSARRQPLPGGWTGWHLHDVTEPRARMDSLLAERARSRFLAAASSRLGLSLNPGRTARAVADLATELTDTAVVVLPVGSTAVEWFRCGPRRAEAGRAAVRDLPEPVTAALHGQAVAPAPLLPAELGAAPWECGGPITGAVVTTLRGNDKPAGALVLLRHAEEAGPADPDDALVLEFAQRAGIALAAAGLYAQQARTAGVLKLSLLEPELPALPGITLGAAYRPADEGLLIGGDFYDVLPAPAGDPDAGALLMLGDVCGKGVDAAVATGQLRQSVRALRRVEPDPVRLLELLNTSMLEAVPADADPRFVTVVLGTAHPQPGGGLRLRLAGGGHPAPLVVRRDGVEPVEIRGTLVGAMRSAHFHSRTVDLAPGEACVLYTDGVTEARGGVDGEQLFGEERLAELLHGCHVLPAPGIAERIVQHTTRWLADDGHDDIAVLVVQAPPAVDTGVARRHLHSVSASPGAESP